MNVAYLVLGIDGVYIYICIHIGVCMSHVYPGWLVTWVDMGGGCYIVV